MKTVIVKINWSDLENNSPNLADSIIEKVESMTAGAVEGTGTEETDDGDAICIFFKSEKEDAYLDVIDLFEVEVIEGNDLAAIVEVYNGGEDASIEECNLVYPE